MAKAIEIEGLGKRYQIGLTHETYRRLSETIADAARRPFRRGEKRARVAGEHWAIRDISLSVEAGEVVGFIGPNGAGKSTLLKVLSRITEPTAGVARLNGRVGALLEVGTGFHPELTGRENIFLNGAILGMTRRDIQRRFDEIVEFSEVGRYLETPVKRYSSGMYVRLAFAVAAHLEPEILLVDEVLAVGDAAFQRKCLGKMGQVAGEGRTVLFVSHNMSTLQSLCQRAYLLNGGRVVKQGETREVVHTYLESVSELAAISLAERTDRQGDGGTRFESITIESATGEALPVGASVRVNLDYTGRQELRNARVLVSIMDVSRTGIYLLDSDVHGGLPDVLPASGTIVCDTGPLMASPGLCYVNVWLYRTGALTDFVTNATTFEVVDGDPYGLGRVPTREWAVGVIDQTWQTTGPGACARLSCHSLRPAPVSADLPRADRALGNAVVHLARTGGGVAHDRDGLVLFAGSHTYPGPYCNGLLRLDRRQAAEATIARGREFFAPQRRSFFVWARDGADDDLIERCRAIRLHERPPSEGMPLVIRDDPLGRGPAEPAAVEITTEASAEEYLSIVSDAYGMAAAPVELQRAIFFTAAAVLHPAAIGVLLHADGRPAAGAMALLTDEIACVLWVATSPWARGRGLGPAVMRAITDAAFRRGATLVVAQSSQAGLPHWTRLGFSQVSQYRRFLAR